MPDKDDEKKQHKRRLKEAEIRQAEAEASNAELELALKALDYQTEKSRHEVYSTTSDMIGDFSFNSGVGEQAVEQFYTRVVSFARRNPGAPISVSLTTPGGSVFDGLHLYDTLRHLSGEGHEITTIASGFAASMGAILLQAGDHRVIGSESLLMIHEVSSFAIGKAGEIKRESVFLERVTKQFCNIMSRRSTLNPDEVFEKIQNNDWWLWPSEALELGFVDEVRKP